jgi:hypothetical protein
LGHKNRCEVWSWIGRNGHSLSVAAILNRKTSPMISKTILACSYSKDPKYSPNCCGIIPFSERSTTQFNLEWISFNLVEYQSWQPTNSSWNLKYIIYYSNISYISS